MTLPLSFLGFGLALLMLLGGCAKPAPTPRGLIGKSEAEVISMMGAPDERSEWVASQPGFGPRPEGLPDGASFTNWFYRDFQGEQWHVMLVTPAVYRSARGLDPGPGEAMRVIELANFPVGAVF